jgi:hypothetical protein
MLGDPPKPEGDGASESSLEEPEPLSPELDPRPAGTVLVRTDSLPEHRMHPVGAKAPAPTPAIAVVSPSPL